MHSSQGGAYQGLSSKSAGRRCQNELQVMEQMKICMRVDPGLPKWGCGDLLELQSRPPHSNQMLLLQLLLPITVWLLSQGLGC
jgi:hypothetical protein